MSKTTIIATGDVFITRRLSEQGYEGFEELRDVIESYDAKFTNLEMTFHDSEGFPAAESGGTWAMTEPGALDDIQRFGFNFYNTANNHSGDYGTGGVLATIDHLKERDMIFSGTGANLAEASRPCYLETRHNRVALISCCSSFHKAEAAGGQSAEIWGRPGLNPLGVVTKFHVEKKYFDTLKEMAPLLDINASALNSIKNGYRNPIPEGTFPFGSESFVLDDSTFKETLPNKKDMARIEAEIREARKQADIVLVSLHAHQSRGVPQNIPAQFIETFSRACIDAGADAMIGHGPHELRGIEIYKNKPIFYSLGNFIFQTETVSLQPYDANYNRGLPLDTKVAAYMDNRSKNGTVGYAAMPEIWKAVMAGLTVEDGKVTQVVLHPICLGMGTARSRQGWPKLDAKEGEETLRYLSGLSEAYGTRIEIRDGIGYINL